MRSIAPQSHLSTEKVRGPLTPTTARAWGLPHKSQPRHIRDWKTTNQENLERGLADIDSSLAGGSPRWVGALFVQHHHDGITDDLGLVSARVVTTAGAGFIVQCWQNLAELETMRYHGMGTGTAAEAASDTALGSELTTAYSTSNTRISGTLTTGGSANIFESVATVTVKSAAAITEHGLFTQAAAPGGTLFDRSVFAALNLATGEGVTFTLDCTIPSGG